MKRSFMILLLAMLMVPIAAIARNFSASFSNSDPSETIAILKKATGYDFVYQKQLVSDLDAKVIGNYNDLPIDKLLDYTIIQQLGLAYKIVDNTITLSEPATTANEGATIIRGTVTNEDGEPLPGATVAIKGTDHRVAANVEGKFFFSKVMDLKSPETIVVTYIGMVPREVKITDKTKFPLHIRMENDYTTFDEVVVTGYNTVERRKLTSSVTTLKAEEIMRPGISSIDQMLEGQVPDMMFMSNSGEVGTVPRLRIRGTSTLIGNREPLWVLDGVVLQDPVNVSPEELNDPDYVNRIGNAISGINPQDIERIDVLKDASATALYGAKAANGVIVVTTKKGHVGKPSISYNMTLSYKQRPRYTDRKIDLMTSQERVAFSKYLVQNGYGFGNYTDLVGYEYLMKQFYGGQIDYNEVLSQTRQLETMNTDWFDLLTKDALSTSHSVSLSGGTDNARYYGSISYTTDNDVIRGNKNDRYTAVLNVNATLSRVFSTQFGITANVNKRDYNQETLSPLQYAYNTSRAIPAYTADGDYAYYQKYNSNGGYYGFNILNELENSRNRQEGNAIQTNFTLNANITDWLKARLIASYQASSTSQESWWGEKTFYIAGLRGSEYGVPAPSGDNTRSLCPFGGELGQNNIRNNNYMARLQFDFNKNLGAGGDHNISATLGFEASSNRYKGNAITSRGYYEDRGRQFSNTTLDSYPLYKSWLEANAYPTITDNLTNLVSGYALVSYSYKNLFTLTANTRIDGSNKFGDRSNEKLLPIWSVSGNYNIAEHSFLKYQTWLDFLMFKASFGYQGNMLDGQSPRLIIQQFPMDPLYNELVSQVSVYPNPRLRWEKTRSWNGGISFSLFNRRLQIEAEGYYKKTTDAFLLKDISTVNGVSSYYVNSGDITNKGFSVSLTAMPVRTRDFDWILSTSISKIYNDLKTLPGQDQYELSDYLSGSALISGKPVGTFYSYKFLGLSPKDGSPLFDDGEEHAKELSGLSKYQFYTTILEESGSREPTISGTLNNTIHYGHWRLNAVLNYSLGSKVRLFKLFNATQFLPSDNINRQLVNHWSKPGDELITDIPNPVTMSTVHWSFRNNDIPTVAYNGYDEYNYGNHRVVSGDYLKFATVSLTYEFARDLISKWGLGRLALNLTGTNLGTICSSKLKGQTPQQSGFSTVQLTDRPQYTFGLEIQF